MATFTGTGNDDTADFTSGTLTGFTGGTLAELLDSIGDSFVGGAGNDVVNAGNGDDTIYGGLGADTLSGGASNDIFQFISGDLAG
ncbi:MAG: calcium-binding protein, partial [Aestuariivirga sp.]